MKYPVYINNNPHSYEREGETIFVDHPDLPARRCASHHLGSEVIYWLNNGMRVYTAGNWYSFSSYKNSNEIETSDV